MAHSRLHPIQRGPGVEPDRIPSFFLSTRGAPSFPLAIGLFSGYTPSRQVDFTVRETFPMPPEESTFDISRCLERLRAGDLIARDELVAATLDRLSRLAHKFLRLDFPRLGRWEQTDDIAQGAALRLYRALGDVPLATPLDYHRFVALQVRRELLDLARRHFGAHGDAAHHASDVDWGAAEPGVDTFDPARLAEWTEFHRQVDSLPDDERAVADLLYYQGLPQEEAARLLGVDVRTVQRRWRRIRLLAHERFKDIKDPR